MPARADLTAGQASERAVLRNSLEAGRLYVIDRGYVEYGLFQAILDVGSSFVARVGANAVTEVVERRTLTEADRAAGVLSDRLVRVGCEANRGKLQDPVRIVEVRLPAAHATGKPGPGVQGRHPAAGHRSTRPARRDHRLVLPASMDGGAFLPLVQVHPGLSAPALHNEARRDDPGVCRAHRVALGQPLDRPQSRPSVPSSCCASTSRAGRARKTSSLTWGA